VYVRVCKDIFRLSLLVFLALFENVYAQKQFEINERDKTSTHIFIVNGPYILSCKTKSKAKAHKEKQKNNMLSLSLSLTHSISLNHTHAFGNQPLQHHRHAFHHNQLVHYQW